MPKFNQILLERYSDITFLLKQISKQHQRFDHAWNYISNDLNMENHTTSKQKEELSYQSIISYLAQVKSRCKAGLKGIK